MLRTAALLLTALTGFCGLVYEIAWQKLLAALLGGHSEATAVVLGLFLGGLAAGYALFGALTRRRVRAARAAGRPARLLLLYGAAEAALGLHALALPALFGGVRALSVSLPLGGGPAGFAADTTLSALLIGPPAVLMGATIPVLTQALSRGLGDATRIHALVYGANTAGAFVGALAAGFWLVPALGLAGVLRAMGACNLAAGAAFALMEARRREPGGPVPEPAARAPSPPAPAARSFAAVAGLVGFAMMAVQTVWNRLGALSLGASQFTFSSIVAVFVLGIAAGSFAVSVLPRVRAGLLVWNLWALLALLALLYGPLDDAPYWGHALRAAFGAGDADFARFHAAAFLGALAVTGPAVAVSGATLPLLFHALRGGAAGLGGAAGRLYAWNTLGSLLGALLGGYALLYWLDLHHVYRLALAAVAVAAGLATWRLARGGALRPALLVAAALAWLALLAPWSPERLAAGAYRLRRPTPYSFAGPDAFFAHFDQGRLVFYDDDPSASIAVKEVAPEDGPRDRAIVTNGKSDSSVVRERVSRALLGLVPALLAERPERAFLIGYGTGVTASALARLESVREVVVAEISPAVVAAAPLFDYANRDASRDPTIRIEVADGYRALLRSRGRFDLIVSEPSNPWIAGVEMLYAREFLEASRERLAPGGVHAQWFQSYEADARMLELILRTYASVFPGAAVWFTAESDLLLLGFRDVHPELDLERLARRMARRDYASGLARCEIRSLPALLAHELLPVGVVRAWAGSGEVHTLLHPRLGHLAARAFFAAGRARLPVTAGLEAARAGARHSLVRRYRAGRSGPLAELEWRELVAETCAHRSRECATLLARWRHEVPRSDARGRIRLQLRAHPEVYGDRPLDALAPLARLYGPGPERADFAAAQAATERFLAFYHHAAPFRRAALGAAWKRCAAGGDPACARGRAAAEALLGDLATPLERTR